MKEYPVVLITDNNYVIPTGVAIQSLIDSYKKNGKLLVYIIACGVDDDNKALLNNFSNNNVEIKIINFSTNLLQKYAELSYYVSPAALVKFCIPRLLPQYDRILYIDGDILVQKDITDIYETDIEDYYAAAVADIAGMILCKFHTRLNLPRYFNSGVLFFNAKRFRAENMEEKLFACKAAHPDYQCMDQDVFNDVFNNEVKFLPQKWNCMMPNFEIISKQNGITMANVDVFYQSNYGTYANMEKDAYILHLTNEKKPWKYKNVYCSEKWIETFKRSPFAQKELILKVVENESAKRGKQKPNTVHRYGIFSKKYYQNHTDLTAIGIPVVQKIKLQNITKIKIIGIPVAKRVWLEYEILTAIFFVFRFRKPNWHKIYQKINSYVDMIPYSSSANKIEYQNKIIHQIKLLDNLKGASL